MNGLLTKAFEIRDRGTFIPVIATQLLSVRREEAYLLERARYFSVEDSRSVIVTRLTRPDANSDPAAWGNRTMVTAHTYIEQHFEELRTGAVIDVEYILGETAEPKVSERLERLQMYGEPREPREGWL